MLAKRQPATKLIGLFGYMNWFVSNLLLAMGAPPQGAQSSAPAWISFAPMILLVVVFYVALIRPQQKKARDHANLLKTLRPGDKIITSGGVLATVVTVKERTLTIRSADAKFEITKSAVTEVTERGGDSAGS